MLPHRQNYLMSVSQHTIMFKEYRSKSTIQIPFTSEREFILGSLLSHTPETVFKLATWNDLLDLKQKGNHFKTKLQKIAYLNKCHQALINLPYNTLELEKIRQHIETQSRDPNKCSGYSDSKNITSNFILASTETCLCSECKTTNSPSVQLSILKPVKFVDKLLPFLL